MSIAYVNTLYQQIKYLNCPLANALIVFLSNQNVKNKIIPNNKITLWQLFTLSFPEYKYEKDKVIKMLENFRTEKYIMEYCTNKRFFDEIPPKNNLDYTTDTGKIFLKQLKELSEIDGL